MHKRLDLPPNIISSTRCGSKIQVTYRVEDGANELALSEFFKDVLICVKCVLRQWPDVTYEYDFVGEAWAIAAETMLTKHSIRDRLDMG
jgi:hypothetical protein